MDRPNIPGSLTVDKSKLTGLHGVELVFSTVRRHRWYWGDIWKDCVTSVLEHSICWWIVTFPSGISPRAQQFCLLQMQESGCCSKSPCPGDSSHSPWKIPN